MIQVIKLQDDAFLTKEIGETEFHKSDLQSSGNIDQFWCMPIHFRDVELIVSFVVFNFKLCF